MVYRNMSHPAKEEADDEEEEDDDDDEEQQQQQQRQQQQQDDFVFHGPLNEKCANHATLYILSTRSCKEFGCLFVVMPSQPGRFYQGKTHLIIIIIYNQRTRELTGARKASHKHTNKDLSRLQ